MPRHLAMISLLIAILLCGVPLSISADKAIELPVLAAIRQNNLGVFEILMMWWDKKPEPNPVQLQWLLAGVRLGTIIWEPWRRPLPMRSNAHRPFNIAEPSLYKGWPINLQAATAQAPVQPWLWGSLPCSRATMFSEALP